MNPVYDQIISKFVHFLPIPHQQVPDLVCLNILLCCGQGTQGCHIIQNPVHVTKRILTGVSLS